MQLISSSNGARRATLTKTFTGGRPLIKIGGQKVRLDRDIARSHARSTSNEMTAGRAILIIALGLTLIGLLLAIPLWIAARKRRTVLEFRTHDGLTFCVAAETNREAKVLGPFAGVGQVALA